VRGDVAKLLKSLQNLHDASMFDTEGSGEAESSVKVNAAMDVLLDAIEHIRDIAIDDNLDDRVLLDLCKVRHLKHTL
jgi:hypothetical protein